MLIRFIAGLGVLCAALASPALATDWNVHPGQSIQSAINQSQDGDRIFVHPGTYTTGLRFFGKRIEVIGVSPDLTTILDVASFNLPALTADAGETTQTKVRNIKFRLGAAGNDAILARVANSGLTLENIAVTEGATINAPGSMLRVEGGQLVVNGLEATGVRRTLLSGTNANVQLTELDYVVATGALGGATVVSQNGGTLSLSGILQVPRGVSCTNVAVSLTGCSLTVREGGDSGVNLSGGSLAIQGLQIAGPSSRAIHLQSNAQCQGTWTQLHVNPVTAGGGVRVPGPLRLEGFSIRNTNSGPGLEVYSGSLEARNGIFAGCTAGTSAGYGNPFGIGVSLVASAVLVSNANDEDVLLEDVDFADCNAWIACNTIDVGGIVGIRTRGDVDIVRCDFLRPRSQSTCGGRTLGMCLGVIDGDMYVQGSRFIFPSTSNYSWPGGMVVGLGVLHGIQPRVARVIDCEVQLSGNTVSAAVFGTFNSPMLVQSSEIACGNGVVFASASGGSCELVDTFVDFQVNGGSVGIARSFYSGSPASISAVRSRFRHSGLSSSFEDAGVMNLNLLQSRFDGWPVRIFPTVSNAIVRECVFDRMGTESLFRVQGAVEIDRSSFYFVGGPVFSQQSGFGTYQAKNSIFYATNAIQSGGFGSDSSITYSLMAPVAPGVGNITGDPLFADPFMGDFSLLPGSPCIDSGDPSSPLDPDGSRADMGARYQYGMADCNNNGISDAVDVLTQDCNFNGRVDGCELNLASDCNQDGQIDACQIASGQLGDCDADGRPNLCEADCNANGLADDCDLQQAALYDCDGNGLVDSCETAAGAALDCNGNQRPDGCDLASGVSLDLNLNGIPDECKPDCNQNNLPDFIEVAYGTVPDCNGNAVPDACDIAAGTATDCNSSGVPDACELSPASDCDADGVLDGCELASGAEPDCNSNGRIDRCDVVGLPSLDCDANGRFDSCELEAGAADCNGNLRLDVCDIASGASVDLNLDGQPDECKPDCNANGIPDYMDVQFGASVDCNANVVPDECELPGDGSLDCDANLFIDLCEVTSGAAPDCNANLVPDGCDLAAMPALDCDADLAIDSCEIAGGTAPDCDGNGKPDGCDIADGARDCDLDGVQDGCELAAGAADGYGLVGSVIVCASNGVPDTCEAVGDEDADGVPDYCEIQAGAADVYGVAGGVVGCQPDGIPDDNQPVADCDADGVPNVCELLAGAADCDGNGLQDSCQANPSTDCDADGVLDTCELAQGAPDRYGLANGVIVCASNGIPDGCEAVGDTDSDGTPDYCEILAGSADVYGLGDNGITCTPDGVPDDNQPVPDCDADGLPNACEILAGAEDCDADGVPDLCQTTSIPAVDCNLNGQIDSCELESGAPDCNANGRLDSCDIGNGFSQDLNFNDIPDDCECSVFNFCVPLPNSTGQPALIGMSGTASLSLNNASLRCTQLPPSASGLFFFGNSGLNPGNPFGNGRLCVTGGVRRLPLAQAVAGVVTQPQDFTGSAYAGIQAGDVRFFQFWYRNPAAGGAGFNLSDGIRVTFCP